MNEQKLQELAEVLDPLYAELARLKYAKGTTSKTSIQNREREVRRQIADAFTQKEVNKRDYERYIAGER